jgi:hypothetical protein
MAPALHNIQHCLEELFTAHVGIGFGDSPERHAGAIILDDSRWGIVLSDLAGHYADARLTVGVLSIRDIRDDDPSLDRFPRLLRPSV